MNGHTADDTITDQQYRNAARLLFHQEGILEIDDHAVISRGSEGGVYVQAWV